LAIDLVFGTRRRCPQHAAASFLSPAHSKPARTALERAEPQVRLHKTGVVVHTSSPLLRPARLSARGKALWTELSDGRTFDPATAVLVAEACRIVDRLEKLDGILRSRRTEWVKLAEQVEGQDVSIVMDGALSESRQQALALRTIFAHLGTAKLGSTITAEGGGTFLDKLAARQADRQPDTSAR